MELIKYNVRKQISSLLKEHMDIDPVLALQDTLFTELHKDFDSLSLLELQLLLEKEFDMEFDGLDRTAKMPTNVSEMADALIREHSLYQQRQDKKQVAQPDNSSESITG
jgi:acyl carrier protein